MSFNTKTFTCKATSKLVAYAILNKQKETIIKIDMNIFVKVKLLL